MLFGLFKRKDPICGMKEEKSTGIEKHGKWFCHPNCLKEYEKQLKEGKQNEGQGDCCH